MEWFIDSWAVLDGIAFASLRQPNSFKADATVFLSVPDLEPVPVGRISTALRAQRNCFQDRFCDNSGDEFAFERLAQVQETIRRAYLSGGLAPSPARLKERPIEPLLSGGSFGMPVNFPQSSGGQYYQQRLLAIEADPSIKPVKIDFSLFQDPEKRKPVFETLHRHSTPALYSYLQAFGEATLLEFLAVLPKDLFEPEIREILSRWIALLFWAGLWQTSDECWSFLASAGLKDAIVGGAGPWLDPGSWLPVNSPLLAARKDTIFHVPCPLLANWSKHIRTLHHKLLLPLVDRTYFETNNQVSGFIPSLFCSLVTAVGSALQATPSSPFLASDRHRLMGRALFWLTSELPRVALPEGVEEVLTDFAWQQLSLNPTTGPAGSVPPIAPPRKNTPLDPSGSEAAPIPWEDTPAKQWASPQALKHS